MLGGVSGDSGVGVYEAEIEEHVEWCYRLSRKWWGGPLSIIGAW